MQSSLQTSGRLSLTDFSARNGIAHEVLMANKRGRDAESGRFITIEEAKRRPKTTVVETIPKPKPKPKK